jgi:uncharacterized protein
MTSGVHGIGTDRLLSLLDPLDPIAVYHFGSSASSIARVHMESDIDLGILGFKACDPYETFLAAQAAARLLKREVDLVDLRRCGTVMASQVVGTGRKLMIRDAREVAEFEMRVLADYARLNEERAPVLAAHGL